MNTMISFVLDFLVSIAVQEIEYSDYNPYEDINTCLMWFDTAISDYWWTLAPIVNHYSKF